MSDFYEFNHRCDSMPECVSFCKLKGSTSSQFSIDSRVRGVLHSATLYGFRYCPYCGEYMDTKAVEQ